ncbi:MAG: competence/damage-inducible protein A [Clostridiales Family XIII bacterium]|jgi:nicotinamide-nucleotide amidase|nr:competence/damage-inducible protein A [Clostridiales Family XIII bacterium]
MKAVIVTVGTELLFGQTVDTNAVYLSQRLQLLGIDVMYRHTVGDNPARLRRILELSYDDCDLVICTGGLGPTQDDLTKEVVCEALGDVLIRHEETVEELNAFFKKLERPMTENNLRQAMLPSKALVFANHHGSAPGFVLENDGRTAICLPGPPREMKPMFEESAAPYLKTRSNATIYYRLIRTFGIGESMLETKISDLIDAQTDPTLATYAKEGECSIRIASKRNTMEEAKQAVADMLSVLRERIGEYIFSDDDEELAAVAVKKLIEGGISISCAESCTGGMFAQRLTDIPGVSAVFDRGFVTYSNNAKIEQLGVSPDTIEKYGAVSEETAREMVRGVKSVSGSRLAIAATGIAGPEGGTDEKPVGLVYIAGALDDREVCKRILLRGGSRGRIRVHAVLNMLFMVLKLIGEPASGNASRA